MEKKFDFKPFEKVLVRAYASKIWSCDFFSNYGKCDGLDWVTCVGASYPADNWEIIPYEGNEHLLGTTDDYVEPYEPKAGDFIAFGKDVTILGIFKAVNDDATHEDYCILDSANKMILPDMEEHTNLCDGWIWNGMRPATEEEKRILLNEMHKEGKDWDAEKMEVVDYKWMPKEDEQVLAIFFDITSCMFTYCKQWYIADMHKPQFEKGWILEIGQDTKAQALCDKLNEAIKNVK